jgi:hypothetical protein
MRVLLAIVAFGKVMHFCGVKFMRGPVRVRETEIKRGIRAAEAAGYRVARIEISSDGKASIITTNGKQEAAPPEPASGWEKALGKPPA